jgi:hypothetical protein
MRSNEGNRTVSAKSFSLQFAIERIAHPPSAGGRISYSVIDKVY